MRSSKPPFIATWLLTSCVSNEPLVGDLREEVDRRSRLWYWHQVLVAVTIGSWRDIGGHKVLALRAVASGWAVLLVFFIGFGDFLANGMAWRMWGWTRAVGYASWIWWPFWVTAALVSYAGFAMSAYAVVRSHRNHAVPMLLAYLVSVLAVLTSSAVFLAWKGMIEIPHPLFYLVSVTLPYQWRAGFVFVPLVILATGLLGSHQTTTPAGRASG